MLPIRPPHPHELERLREIERAAGALFLAVGLPEIAGDEPPTIAELEAFRGAGRAWVAVDAGDRPIAYLVSTVVDGSRHVEQVSVHPLAARQGVGAALIDVLGSPVTLTTFRDVPWNAPYYARLGFVVVPPDEQGPELAALVAEEARRIPGDAPRVAMRRVSGR